MIRRFFDRFRRDERGLTIIEFAYIAPTLLVLMMGTFDLGHRTYVRAILEGELQRAARLSTLETGALQGPVLDEHIQTQTSRVVKNGTWAFSRKSYSSFTRAGQAENFNDGNGNGIREVGECFQDENFNGSWDSDGGRTGQGGADDIVVYTASVTFPRLFPMYGLLGWSPNQTVGATTVLRNQPYADQIVAAPVVICT